MTSTSLRMARWLLYRLALQNGISEIDYAEAMNEP